MKLKLQTQTRLTLACAAAIFIGMAGPAGAGVLFQEKFDSFPVGQRPIPGNDLPGWNSMKTVNGLIASIVDLGGTNKACQMNAYGGGASGWSMYAAAVLPTNTPDWTYSGTVKFVQSNNGGSPWYGIGGLWVADNTNGLGVAGSIGGNSISLWYGRTAFGDGSTAKAYVTPQLLWSLGGQSGSVSIAAGVFVDEPGATGPVTSRISSIGNGTIVVFTTLPDGSTATLSKTFTGDQASALDSLRYIGTGEYFSVYQYDDLKVTNSAPELPVQENFNSFPAGQVLGNLTGWMSQTPGEGLVTSIVDVGGGNNAYQLHASGSGEAGWSTYATALIRTNVPSWTCKGTVEFVSSRTANAYEGTGGLLLSSGTNGVRSTNWLWIGFARLEYDGTNNPNAWVRPMFQWQLAGASGSEIYTGPMGAFRDFPGTDTDVPIYMEVSRTNGTGTITFYSESPMDGNRTFIKTFTGAQAAALDSLQYVGVLNSLSVYQYDDLGLASTVPPPTPVPLQIAVSNELVWVSWPVTSDSRFILQTNANLAIGNWGNGDAPFIVGSNNVVTNRISSRPVFYRLVAGPAGDGEPVLPYLRYSFEQPEELADWWLQPSVTTRQTRRFATDGGASMMVTVGAGAPWFGVGRSLDCSEMRKAEFLEMDLKAATPIYYLAVMLNGGGVFQDLQIAYDDLQPGETHHLRIRLTDNELVQFGTNTTLSIWCGNPTALPVSWYVDNVRLTGYGGNKAKMARVRDLAWQRADEIAALQDVALTMAWQNLLSDVEGLLAATEVSDAQVSSVAQRWDLIVRDCTLKTLQRDGVSEQRFTVGVESSMVKVARRSTIGQLACPLRPTDLSLSLARHEYESKQLVFVPLSTNQVSNLRVEVTDLAGTNATAGHIIPKENVELYLVDDVNINGSDQTPYQIMTGYYPDPLMPNGNFDLRPDRLQCVWVTVYAPTNAATGNYSGTIRITAGGQLVRSLGLTTTVRNFQIPVKSTLKTLFGLWPHNWVNFYRYATYPKWAWHWYPTGQDIPGTNILEVLDFCNRYRMGAGGYLTWPFFGGQVQWPVRTAAGGCDFAQGPRPGDVSWDQMAEKILQVNPVMGAGVVAGDTYDKSQWPTNMVDVPAVITALTNYVTALNTHVQQKGWGGKVYFYMYDEPRTPQQWQAAIREANLVKNAAPGIKTMITSGPPDNAPYPFDIYVPLLDRIGLNGAHQLQQGGKEVWWYTAGIHNAPYPYWALHHDGIDPRIMPLMTFKYRIDGFLHWAANLWGEDNCDPNNPVRWPEREWTCKEWTYQPGEGYMYYPGTGGHPWPSVRLENWRDGMEDYEYLTLLKAKLPDLVGADRTNAEALLGLGSVINERYDFTRNPEDVYQMRERVGDLIERASP